MNPQQTRSSSNRETLLTIAEFSDRICMSQSWTRKNIYRRRITIIRLGRSVRVPESELSRLRVAGRVAAIATLR